MPHYTEPSTSGGASGLWLYTATASLGTGIGSFQVTYDTSEGSTSGATWNGTTDIDLTAGLYLLVGAGTATSGGTGRLSMRWSDQHADNSAVPQQQDGFYAPDISLGVNYRGTGVTSIVHVPTNATIKTWLTKSVSAALNVLGVSFGVIRL